MQETTLILNASYEPLGTVHWTDAITMWHTNKCDVVEEYDQVIRSAHLTMRVPAVVRLKNYVTKPVKNVKFSRANVYARDEYKCQYCGTKCRTDELTYDHVLPRSKGGTTVWENIVSCCYDCNSKKGGRTPEQAKMRLHKKPVRPKAVPKIEFEFHGRSIPEQWRDYVYWTGELDGGE
jgi:5-methylcytosine-specific restriction endonuclease McrA